METHWRQNDRQTTFAVCKALQCPTCKVMSTNWADYLTLVYSVPFWEAPCQSIQACEQYTIHEHFHRAYWSFCPSEAAAALMHKPCIKVSSPHALCSRKGWIHKSWTAECQHDHREKHVKLLTYTDLYWHSQWVQIGASVSDDPRLRWSGPCAIYHVSYMYIYIYCLLGYSFEGAGSKKNGTESHHWSTVTAVRVASHPCQAEFEYLGRYMICDGLPSNSCRHKHKSKLKLM